MYILTRKTPKKCQKLYILTRKPPKKGQKPYILTRKTPKKGKKLYIWKRNLPMGNSAHCAWEDGPQRQAWSLDHTVVQCNLPYWKDWKGWKTHICNILHLCQWIYVFEELTMQVWVGSYCQHAFIDNAVVVSDGFWDFSLTRWVGLS